MKGSNARWYAMSGSLVRGRLREERVIDGDIFKGNVLLVSPNGSDKVILSSIDGSEQSE